MKHIIRGTKTEDTVEWHLLHLADGGMFVLANGETVLSVKDNVVRVDDDSLARVGLELKVYHS